MIKTVLFDLDGTLVPFIQSEFVKAYLGLLCAELEPQGYGSYQVATAVWDGCESMINNDGTVLNHTRFWDAFAAALGEDVRKTEPMLDAFYGDKFHQAKKMVMRGESVAKTLVESLKAKGYQLVLATNPLFPKVAQLARMSWVGLEENDFCHITHYQNSSFCKPNPLYYREIMDTLGLKPEECLMVGNSVEEDMVAASLGMQVYLVEGFVENSKDLPMDIYPRGPLAGVEKML